MIESRGGEVRREHQHFHERAASEGGINEDDLASALPFDLDEAALKAESMVLDLALEKTGGNLTEAARILGTTRNRAYRIVKTATGFFPLTAFGSGERSAHLRQGFGMASRLPNPAQKAKARRS